MGGVLCGCGVGWCALREGVVCRKARMASPRRPPAQPAALSLHSHPPLSPSTLSLLCSSPAHPPLSSFCLSATLPLQSSPPFPSRLRSNHALRSVLGVWPSNILSLNALPKYPAFRAMQDICLTSCSTELCVCRTCDSVKVGSGLVGEYGCLVAFFVFRTCLAG